MAKHVKLFALFLVFVFCTSYKGKGKSDLPKHITKSETKEVSTSHGPNTMVRNVKQDRNVSVSAGFHFRRY
ncbi:MAG: hypothetical protein ABIU11_08185 [Chitinophagaceae bacterium]